MKLLFEYPIIVQNIAGMSFAKIDLFRVCWKMKPMTDQRFCRIKLFTKYLLFPRLVESLPPNLLPFIPVCVGIWWCLLLPNTHTHIRQQWPCWVVGRSIGLPYVSAASYARVLPIIVMHKQHHTLAQFVVDDMKTVGLVFVK